MNGQLKARSGKTKATIRAWFAATMYNTPHNSIFHSDEGKAWLERLPRHLMRDFLENTLSPTLRKQVEKGFPETYHLSVADQQKLNGNCIETAHRPVLF